MAGYEFIGQRVSDGDVELTEKDAQRFYELARQGSRIKDLQISDTETFIRSSSYASSELSDVWGDYNVANYMHMAKSHHVRQPLDESAEQELAYDHSIIHFSKFRSSNRNIKIFDSYEVEQLGDELLTAKRTVRVVRHVARVAIEQQSEAISEDELVGIRKAFERPMTEEDVDRIETRVRQIMARQAVFGRR